MSKLLFRLFLFLIFSFILYCALLIIWVEIDYNSYIRKNIRYELNTDGNINSSGYMFSRAKEIKSVEEVDLLFIGSSQAYRGLDTRIFKKAGYSSFNLGSSNQTPLQTELLLKRYLNQLNPKLVIYVVYPEVFTMDGVESTLNIMANDQIDIAMAILAIKQRNLKLFNTLIYAGYRHIFKLNSHFVEPDKKGNDTYVKGGYVEKQLLTNGYRNYKKNTWEYYDYQFKAFERSLQRFKKENVKFILIQAPTTKSFYASYTNNAGFDDIMHEYGEYYNFNTLVNLDDSAHFYDQFHLNQLGVTIFNTQLIELLKNK